jgi:hypothetical protein
MNDFPPVAVRHVVAGLALPWSIAAEIGERWLNVASAVIK